MWYSGKLFPILSSRLRRSSIYLKLDGMTGGQPALCCVSSIARTTELLACYTWQAGVAPWRENTVSIRDTGQYRSLVSVVRTIYLAR